MTDKNFDFMKKLAPRSTEELEEILKKYPLTENSNISEEPDKTVVDEPVEVITRTPWYRRPAAAVAAAVVLITGIGTIGLKGLSGGNIETSPMTSITASAADNVTVNLSRLTPAGASLNITDLNEEPLHYGRAFTLYQGTDAYSAEADPADSERAWEEVTIVSGDEEKTFTSEALLTDENGQLTIDVQWDYIYGELDEGDYCIKISGSDGENDYAIRTEFSIDYLEILRPYYEYQEEYESEVQQNIDMIPTSFFEMCTELEDKELLRKLCIVYGAMDMSEFREVLESPEKIRQQEEKLREEAEKEAEKYFANKANEDSAEEAVTHTIYGRVESVDEDSAVIVIDSGSEDKNDIALSSNEPEMMNCKVGDLAEIVYTGDDITSSETGNFTVVSARVISVQNDYYTDFAHYYELEDGGFFAEGQFYKELVEVTVQINDEGKYCTFIYLSNVGEIDFHRAMMAAGLSSNTEDYFKPEEALLIEMI